MTPDDETYGEGYGRINSRIPTLPPTTRQQAIDALLSPLGLASSLIHSPVPTQPGLGSMLGYDGPMATPLPGLAGALVNHGITTLPDSDPRLVNMTTDPQHPAFQTAKGTVINVNHPRPDSPDPKAIGTFLPWGDNLDHLVRTADAVGGITLNGGSEANGHKESPLDAHHRNLAIDVAWDPKLDPETLRRAAMSAGYTHGIYEGNHWHFQVGPDNIKDDPSVYELSAGPIRPTGYTKKQKGNEPGK